LRHRQRRLAFGRFRTHVGALGKQRLH
jgi:hypothetical protein